MHTGIKSCDLLPCLPFPLRNPSSLPMALFRCRKMRLLYLLALLQLVGGPLVLLHVSVFCKATLEEAPRVGIAKAAAAAWHSEGFQAALIADALPEKPSRKESDTAKPKFAKQAPATMDFPTAPTTPFAGSESVAETVVTWTPRWPNAPPGPPPRFV